MVTLKSSNDNDRPLGVVSGCSISNFKLGCTLFIIWWKYSIWGVGDGFFLSVSHHISNATDRIQNLILHLPKHDISDLLQVTLNNMYFSFRDQVFRQREGLLMGSSISGILAILFMGKLDTVALSTHLMISPYMRYVDDIYLESLDFRFCFLNSSLRLP